MVRGPLGQSTKTFSCFLGLGVVVVWLCMSAGSIVEASCGSDGGANPRQIHTSTRSGELSLTLYSQYSAGGLSYTLVPPGPPCHGPHCGATPRMKPIGALPWTVRVVGSMAFDCCDKALEIDPPYGQQGEHPRSVFAPRGCIATLEHPPKFLLA